MVRIDSDGTETLEVKVIADTQDFSKSVAEIGGLLEKNLLNAVRKGSLGFDDLKRVAFSALDEIAAQALGTILHSGGGKGGGLLGGLGGIVGSILGLPGRATGGNVAPGRGFLVGERGPELFVPTSAGRVEPNSGGGSREVRVSINVVTPHGSNAPQALQRSTRQVASAVRRALTAS
jgi:hypothetical protein